MEANLTDIPKPTYINGICTNITQQIDYIFTHNWTGGILGVIAEVRLGSESSFSRFYKQRFSVRFLWGGGGPEDVFVRSGRPGYRVGKPLLLGRMTENMTEEGKGDYYYYYCYYYYYYYLFFLFIFFFFIYIFCFLFVYFFFIVSLLIFFFFIIIIIIY